LELFGEITKNIKMKLAAYSKPSVNDVFLCFKEACLESGIENNPDVSNYEIYSEHYFGQTQNSLRFALQYHLEYQIESDEFAHYEAIDCVFNVTDSMSEKSPYLMGDSESQTMEKMLEGIERWPIFQLLKKQCFDFEICGEAH